jgi:sugar O-acyltransferase (sialic acid O-acetyltransferase NeuD family)
MRVLILGAGGHAQVVADILLCLRQAGEGLVPIGYLDDNPELTGQHLLSLPVLGPIAELPAISHDAVIVAVGDNKVRQALFEEMRSRGENFAIARHPSAVIASDVQVNAGSVICANAVINTGSLVGANVILNTGCTVDHHNHIGDHAHIAPGVHLGGDVRIGSGTLVGIGATVMPQRRVGAWSVVSAGAVVHTNLGDGIVAAGVPARVVRNLVAEN